MASRKRSISDDSHLSGLIKEWDETSCPICMDHPHNAVLLICSSHGKGCRSYICDTSYRHSNCLDRFKKLKEENADSLSEPPNQIMESLHDAIDTSAGPVDLETWIQAGGYRVDHTPTGTRFAAQVTGTDSAAEVAILEGLSGSSTHNVNSDSGEPEVAVLGRRDLGDNSVEKSEDWSNLSCPLCRGSVLGWQVVEEARKYLNLKSRSCSRESCSFTGNYRELRRHARRVHPTVRPADVDPSRQRAWRRLEDQREYNDIVSAIQSAMPGAVVLGDYVIENGDRLSAERDRGGGSGGAGQGGRWLSTFFLFHMIGSMDPGTELRGGRPRVLPRHRRVGARRRYLWGENLLGLQNDDDDEDEEDEDEDNEPELNILSDLGDNPSQNPRRRRRLTRAQSDEDQQ